VEQTVVPAALWDGYLFDAFVLLYPRTVGIFGPASTEWIVMVIGEWFDWASVVVLAPLDRRSSNLC